MEEKQRVTGKDKEKKGERKGKKKKKKTERNRKREKKRGRETKKEKRQEDRKKVVERTKKLGKVPCGMGKEIDRGGCALSGMSPTGFHVRDFEGIANGLHVMSAVGGTRTEYRSHTTTGDRTRRLLKGKKEKKRM